MSAVALPRNLVSPPVVHGDDRVKSSSVKILPANANSTYSPTSGNRIVFNLPAYAKSFINPQRTYLSFNIKKTGTAADSRLVDGVPWIDRIPLVHLGTLPGTQHNLKESMRPNCKCLKKSVTKL